jgi:hypothetical protein
VDCETGQVYGHVIGTDPLGHALVVPLVHTIQQIKSSFGAKTVILADLWSERFPVAKKVQEDDATESIAYSGPEYVPPEHPRLSPVHSRPEAADHHSDSSLENSGRSSDSADITLPEPDSEGMEAISEVEENLEALRSVTSTERQETCDKIIDSIAGYSEVTPYWPWGIRRRASDQFITRSIT